MAATSSLGNEPTANASSAQAFYSHFRSSTDALLSQLSDGVTSQELLQRAVQSYAGLNAELTQAVDSRILPSHDHAAHKRRLEEVATALEEKRKALGQQQQGNGVGKKQGGFAFKRKKPTVAAASQSSVSTESESIPTDGATLSLVEARATAIPTFQGRQASHLNVSALESTRYKVSTSCAELSESKTSVSIDVTDISDSIVDLRPLASQHTILAVQIRSVTNSALLLPPIEGSIMIHGLASSLLSIPSCHQFRMHNSRQSVVELSTKRGSVVTLEGCGGISFVTKAGEPIKVQDFDDLINSEQLKQQDVRNSKANFDVFVSDGSSLANRAENLSSTESSIGACVKNIKDSLHTSSSERHWLQS